MPSFRIAPPDPHEFGKERTPRPRALPDLGRPVADGDAVPSWRWRNPFGALMTGSFTPRPLRLKPRFRGFRESAHAQGRLGGMPTDLGQRGITVHVRMTDAPVQPADRRDSLAPTHRHFQLQDLRSPAASSCFPAGVAPP